MTAACGAVTEACSLVWSRGAIAASGSDAWSRGRRSSQISASTRARRSSSLSRMSAMVRNRAGSRPPVVSADSALDVRTVARTLRIFPSGERIVEPRDPSAPNVDQSVTDIEVFEHLMGGVPLSALLAAIRKFAKQSLPLASHGTALFTVAVDAVALP